MTFDPKSRETYAVWTTDIIRYQDLDPNTHVNHTSIAAYFEDGRVRLRNDHLAALGDKFLTGFVLAKLTLQFHAEVHFPGSVDIGTSMSRLGNTSYSLTQGLFQGDVCVASAEVVTVLLDTDTRRPKPLSDEMRAALQELRVPVT